MSIRGFRRSPRVGLAFAISVVAVTLALTAASPARSASDGWGYGWGRTTVTCIQLGTGGVVFAHLDSSMWVNNRGTFGHWVTNFRLKARLIPTTSGLNWSRSWRTKRFPVLSTLFQDRNYNRPMSVNTDTVNPEADWNVQVKQIWSRNLPWRDLVHEFVLPFDTSKCRVRGGDAMTFS